MARLSILAKIRKESSPRKKRGDASATAKKFEVIRIPRGIHRKLSKLKIAYEIALSERTDFYSMSDEELENWTMEHLTMEEFFSVIYEVVVRADKKHLTEVIMKTAELVESQMDGTASAAHDVETLTKKQLQSMRRFRKAYGGD